jgi:1-deoxy-D-xylulose-5-phosphate synthase
MPLTTFSPPTAIHIAQSTTFDQVELMNMIQTAYEHDSGPSVVRYPRGSGYGLATLNDVLGAGLQAMPTRGEALPIGKGRIVREGRAGARARAAILSIGARLVPTCLVSGGATV